MWAVDWTMTLAYRNFTMVIISLSFFFTYVAADSSLYLFVEQVNLHVGGRNAWYNVSER